MKSTNIKQIHIIFKTHLDVGYTDFAANVVQHYFNHYIPAAIELARSQREKYGRQTFVWTTGSWLIYEYLEQAAPIERKRMEDAILAGDIAWHALPFTVHSENLSPALYRVGISLSKQLDQRFGRRTIAAKMTDVPCHTRGIVPLLAEAGVQFLHIGVNPASTPPKVPPVFIWRDPSGAEIIVMYHKGSYGETMVVPGLSDAITFAHTNDNLGPQDEVQLAAVYAQMKTEYPSAQALPSTLDAFALRLATIREQLPIITAEMGDTWIHGIGTDPAKEARYRELTRLMDEWSERGIPSQTFSNFSRKLLPVPEHTWGLDIKTHLQDFAAYRAQDFRSHRNDPSFRKVEASWDEQRAYLDDAVVALPVNLREEAIDRLVTLVPAMPDLNDYTQINPEQLVHTRFFTAQFDPNQGGLLGLQERGKRVNWAGPKNPLAYFWYQSFSAADYERFYKQYVQNLRVTRSWAIPDFGKPGFEEVAVEHYIAGPKLTWLGQSRQVEGNYLMLMEMPETSWLDYGAPRRLSLEIGFDPERPQVDITLQWFDKPACRLPEALWLSFTPRIRNPHAWQLQKLGQWISPYDVIFDGNRHLHGVGTGARYDDGKHQFLLETLDTALLAPGDPSLLIFTNRQPNLRHGLHANLFNNLWGTNFPMWSEGDARFRFRFRLS